MRLSEQVEALKLGSQGLVEETSKLVSALRKPQVRGQYGEIQLERVAELAGMTNYCDFTTQIECARLRRQPASPGHGRVAAERS